MKKREEIKMKKEKQKKSKYPEWYIGRPKPMKTKTFEFHKPTKITYIKLVFCLAILAFLTYIVVRLVQVGNQIQPKFEYYTSEKNLDKYEIENDFLKLEVDGKTTQIVVTNKKDGRKWYSSPVDLDNDPIALPKEKNRMRAPFLVKYSTITGTDDIYDVYLKSVKDGYYQIESKGNEIHVNYTIGDIRREYIIPLAFYETDLDKFSENMSDSEKRKVLRAYRRYEYDLLKNDEEREKMTSKYPKIEEESLYVLFDNAQEYLKAQVEEIFAKYNFTQKDYEHYKEIYKESVITEDPTFNLSIIYKLEGNKLSVEIPLKDISYRIKYPMVSVSILPYFGAGSSKDSGYLFVPEGSGSIINFNNGKLNQATYYSDMYGWDFAEGRDAVITETKNEFPVFGIANGNDSFVSIIESGSEYAGITAEISGKLGNYNYSYASYDILHREQFKITSRNNNAQFSYENSLNENEVIKQSYYFLDSNSYIDMAKCYRNYLFNDSKKNENNEIPLVVEIIGAIEKVQQVAGIPKTKPLALTDYNQSAQIIKTIQDFGYNDVRYKLSGFINEGIRQTLMTDIDFISELGGKSDFKKMLKTLQETDSKLYLNGNVQTSYRSGITDGFFKYSDSARFVSDELCELYEYSPIWYGKEDTRDTYFLLNKQMREKSVKELLNTVKKYNIYGVSFGDYGNVLCSDFNKKNHLSRVEARQEQQKAFNSSNEQNLKVLVTRGNDYSLKYVDCICDMKLHGKSFGILDYSIPFYQIALHGYVDYVSDSLNTAADVDQLLLESAECGAGLHFVFTGSEEKMVQESNYTEFYSTCFDTQKDLFERICKEYITQMDCIKNSLITNHEFINSMVTKTYYDNGYSVYVNFGYTKYSDKNISLEPRSYLVVKENN